MNRKAVASVPGFGPDALTVGARHLEVGSEHVASFAVVGYPREVQPGWLQPLLTWPGRLDVCLHIDPVDPVTAANRLQKQLARLESGRRRTADHGRLPDPHVEAATEDAYELSARVARGEGKLYNVGLYLTVHADNAEHLAAEVSGVRALAASLLLDAKPATYRAVQGWVTTMPVGLDRLKLRRTFDTHALSASFPFTSPDLAPPDPVSSGVSGVLYGHNLGSQSVVCHDRFSLDNHNATILGRSGSGKSYLVKLELLRSLYRGIEIAVIDPEAEYTRLAAAVGGTHLQLGSEHVTLNPLDLPLTTNADGRRTAPADTLVQRGLFTHTVIETMLDGPLSADERAATDTAITTAYQAAGITSDPRTWTRPAPLLGDVAAALRNHGGQPGTALAARLRPFTDGAFSGLFNAPTTTRPDGHLVVFNLRGLADELKPVGTLLTLDTIWRRITNPAARRPRLLIVDEAWLLMQQPAGTRYLARLAKAARKHWAGLTLATQDVGDILTSDLGRAVVANSATQILLRQAPQAIDDIARAFNLTAGERQFLLSAEQGQGLLSTGIHRVAFHAVASEAEDELITTSPEFLATLPDNDPNSGTVIVE